MSALVQYPSAGCVVEYLEGNAVQIALVMEENGGKLRLLLPNRRETRLAGARLLPWAGPVLEGSPGKDACVRALEACRRKREEAADAVPVLDIWEMAQGEVPEASASWFAELAGLPADADGVAAYGRALLACKSHFRFQPPLFQVFDAETVEKRLNEQREREERENLIAGGAAFLRALLESAGRRGGQTAGDAVPPPAPEVAARLRGILFTRMADPETQEDEALWRMLSKGLPDVPHLPYQLLAAWGEIPPHYNFWLDRAGYAPGDVWWHGYREEVERLLAESAAVELPSCDLPFVSIDSASTRDVDDAFFVEELPEGGWRLTLALACPALCWPFGGAFDKAVLRRGTSIYLPEGNCHMLPECLGTDLLSLAAGRRLPALCVRVDIRPDGTFGGCVLSLARVRLEANLPYTDCQEVLDAGDENRAPDADNPATPFAGQLRLGRALARARQNARIADGAVVMERPAPSVTLVGEGADVRVYVAQDKPCPDTQAMIAEMMILASAAVADWGAERSLPLLHRTQDVALPREYAGVWSEPQDMARIMRALIPSSLEVQARPHAALGLARYAPMTSPLRRYSDLVNEAQLTHMLLHGTPRWTAEELQPLLTSVNVALEAAGQVQRFRPRYWKLLYFRQQGDRVWWDGVITEENDLVVSVSLPEEGLFVRGRRRLFDERACPGMAVRVRIGKVNPLYNEISIVEAVTSE